MCACGARCLGIWLLLILGHPLSGPPMRVCTRAYAQHTHPYPLEGLARSSLSGSCSKQQAVLAVLSSAAPVV